MALLLARDKVTHEQLKGLLWLTVLVGIVCPGRDTWQLDQEAAGYIVSAVRKQRVKRQWGLLIEALKPTMSRSTSSRREASLLKRFHNPF